MTGKAPVKLVGVINKSLVALNGVGREGLCGKLGESVTFSPLNLRADLASKETKSCLSFLTYP